MSSISSNYLYLNTKDAINPNEPSIASWSMPEIFKISATNRISLIGASFANAVYPVNSNNNSIVFQEDNTAVNIAATLTPGIYTGSSLATELKAALEANGANTYTITYSSATLKLSIATSGTNIKFVSGSALRVIGFEALGFISAPTGSFPVRLDGSQYIDLISSIDSANISTSGRNILARIPIGVSVGSLVVYENPLDVGISFDPKNISSIDIRLSDDQGNLWLLPSNCQANYTFICSFHE
jgi:hypothetical protein